MDISKDLLSKDFPSQFKSQEDVSCFMKALHAKVYEDLLECEMDLHLGYEKHSVGGNNSGNSRNGSYSKRIQTEHGE
jgi:transposase-like protein